MNKSESEIPVINIENIDYTRGFVDCMNIQEEYSERAEVILERLQDKSRRQENPKEKRRKLCDHLKSLFHQKLCFLRNTAEDQLLKSSARLHLKRDTTFQATYQQSGLWPQQDRLSTRSFFSGSQGISE